MIKKKKINLILNREDYQKYENFFKQFKIIVIVFAGLFFITSIILFLIIINKTNLEKDLINQKEFLFETINKKTNNFAKINYLEQKYQDLKKFLKDDAFSSYYYNLLNSAINQSSEEASLKSFNIDKSRNVFFTVNFLNFDNLRGFLKFVESSIFLDNFETLSLKSYLISGANENTKESYELSFEGKFKLLNN